MLTQFSRVWKTGSRIQLQLMPALLLRRHGFFSHMILVNFVDKRGFWPPIRFSARGSELERLRNVGMLTISKRSYPLSDWENAVIHDIATFSFDEDYLSLLADKASCAGLEHRVQHYNHRLSPPHHEKTSSQSVGFS
jgi:hypothetical protein